MNISLNKKMWKTTAMYHASCLISLLPQAARYKWRERNIYLPWNIYSSQITGNNNINLNRMSRHPKNTIELVNTAYIRLTSLIRFNMQSSLFSCLLIKVFSRKRSFGPFMSSEQSQLHCLWKCDRCFCIETVLQRIFPSVVC